MSCWPAVRLALVALLLTACARQDPSSGQQAVPTASRLVVSQIEETRDLATIYPLKTMDTPVPTLLVYDTLVRRSPSGQMTPLLAERVEHPSPTTWRLHLTDWLRTNGGFIQLGDEPPSTSVLPGDAVSTLIDADTGAAHAWIFVGRWLFMDRGDDVGILTDAPRLLRWIEQTFTDLLPLWSSVYRGVR